MTSHAAPWFRTARRVAVIALVALAMATVGCSGTGGTTAAPSGPAPAEPAAQKPAPEEPKYSKWIVYINDDDSYTKGSITYSVALNLTATNPTSDKTGTYKGKATAKSDTAGTVNGQPLNASAIANSSQLHFKLVEGAEGGALSSLTSDTALYSGSGSITMKAAGSGSIGAAGGGFSNTSSQPIKVEVVNDKVTLSVNISGHKYSFNGTLRGE